MEFDQTTAITAQIGAFVGSVITSYLAYKEKQVTRSTKQTKRMFVTAIVTGVIALIAMVSLLYFATVGSSEIPGQRMVVKLANDARKIAIESDIEIKADPELEKVANTPGNEPANADGRADATGQVARVVLPADSIHSGGGPGFEPHEGGSQALNAQMVQQGGEPRFLVLSGSLPHPHQLSWHNVGPALGPGRPQALGSAASASSHKSKGGCAFGGFFATMACSDFPAPCIAALGLAAFTARCVRPSGHAGQQDLEAGGVHAGQGGRARSRCQNSLHQTQRSWRRLVTGCRQMQAWRDGASITHTSALLHPVGKV